MSARVDPQIDTTLRKEQLVTLNKNLDILLHREAKYGGSNYAPLDLINQIEDHRQAINLIQQALSSQLTEQELNEALKPLLLALRNGQVIEISVSQPRWLRPVAFITMAMVMVVLLGVGFIIFKPLSQAEKEVYPTPNSKSLTQIPNWPVTVTALAVYSDNENSVLWIGGESGSKYALYSADPTKKGKAIPKHTIDVEGRIIGLAVDCKGNIWVLVQGVGVQVFRPGGRSDTLLNNDTTNWLKWNTTDAITTRCLDDGWVEVWLGREGIQALRYQSDYPTLATIKFLEPEQENNWAYQASQELSQITSLTYLTTTQTLWATDYFSKLLKVPFSIQGSYIHSFNQDVHLFSLATSPDEESIWAGADDYLVYVQDSQDNKAKVIPLGGGENTHKYHARVVGVNKQGVWFGGECSDKELTCQPLGFYNHQLVMPIEIGDHKKVNTIIVDNESAVWIGTDKGLLIYNE